MDSNKKTQIENSIRYSYRKLNSIRFEVSLLQIELEGLFALSKNLSDYKAQNIDPEVIKHLSYEDVSYKWSEQSTRYHEMGVTVSKIVSRKPEEFKNISKFLKS